MVRLAAVQAAFPPIGLGKVRLPYAARPDERQVLPRMQVRQRWQLAERGSIPAPYTPEVEALEGLRRLLDGNLLSPFNNNALARSNIVTFPEVSTTYY